MKTVQFKDIHEKVQGFLVRVFNANLPSSHKLDLDWLHALPLWSCATDDERLAYAEWRYKVGVRLKDAYDDEEYGLKLRDTIFYLEKDPRSPHDILLTRHEHHTNITIYDSDKNKWAEIIEEPFNLTDTGDFRSEPEFKAGDEPSALTKAKQALHDHIQSNPEKVKQDLDKMRELSNEFKAGDEVEVHLDDADWGEDEWLETKFYCWGNGKPVCYLAGSNYKEGNLFAYDKVRKPDPDAKLKEIAKAMISKSHGFEAFPERTAELMVEYYKRIEALKKGKEL